MTCTGVFPNIIEIRIEFASKMNTCYWEYHFLIYRSDPVGSLTCKNMIFVSYCNPIVFSMHVKL